MNDFEQMRGKRLLTSDGEPLRTDYRGPSPLPGELPDLRNALRRAWEPGQVFPTIASMMVMDGRIDDASTYSKWEMRTFADASLWWVSADMCDVLMAAAQSVPDDVRGADVLPLDSHGLVVLEKPWTGLSVDGDKHPDRKSLAVDAFSWGSTRIPPIPTRDACVCLSLSAYQWTPQEHHGELLNETDRLLRQASVNGRTWFPLGRSDWPLEDELNVAPYPMSETQLASFKEDRTVLCALMTILAHDGIATTHVETAPRGTRRRLEREGDKSGGKYRVVTLRTLRDPGDETGNEAGEKRSHDHRWIVSGHWRRQPYGPRRELRRLQWINPFVKGPEDAPIEVKETIRAWRR